MAPLRTSPAAALAFAAFSALVLSCGAALAEQDQPPQGTTSSPSKQTAPAKHLSPDEELHQVINNAGNDRAALVRSLESFLKKYPEAPQRPQIYRALVEASLQLRDTTRAADYAERIVALTPEDMSITLLAIQLLERSGDEAALRRATTYATRVMEYVERSSSGEKSPRVSQEDWESEKKRDRMTILLLRGRLFMKQHDLPAAQKDCEASYALLPSAGAAEKLGEIAELNKDLTRAAMEYARAFALSDAAGASAGRHEVRQRLGNVWRQAHGSDDGLGEYLLRTYDEVTAAAGSPRVKRNASAHELYEFTLRKAPEGLSFPLADTHGKILVVNFWATWCGPCRAMEPHFEHVASQFQASRDIVFLSANCDEDESLVPPYLEAEKPRTTVVYADGLDRLLAVNSFPTMMVLDRTGKIAYRAEGFDPDSAEKDLADAVRQAMNLSGPRPAATRSATP